MKAAPFPVLFTTDSGYVPHLATALYSLLTNNRSLNLEIFVLTVGLPENDAVNLRGIASLFGTSLKSVEINDSYLESLPLGAHFQKSNYYRLFAAEFLEVDKCLYLDSDVIVEGSINELLKINLDDYPLAAVENPGFSRHSELGMSQNSKYFNSGVMIINLEMWREKNIAGSVLQRIKRKPEVIHNVDQCGLNSVVDGNWLELPSKYNFQTAHISDDPEQVDTGGSPPVIVHFTGSGKPWHMKNKHPYRKNYWRYRKETPYRAFVPDDFSLKSVLQGLLPNRRKHFLKRFLASFRR